MMTQMQMLHIFWNMWGNHDLNFYRVYVEYGAITKADYKEITGHDYDEGTNSASTAPTTSAANSSVATSQAV